ncbi:dienelactone hydrolase family protein [Allosalinactinospora lopnorensis]|uniref:dienelactone hydrolase family protein n=1 Tax=Allosalinactinospora lopnorensis TaxID=1352348 RepID=UPI000623E48B|nr:dienelactone hydrolase family protein [Allosalinactinospora lopnorensis]
MDIRNITAKTPDADLSGDLAMGLDTSSVVLFAHGSGSSRHSPRNRAVAEALNRSGFGTLLLDLLTEEEGRRDEVTRELRFDIPLLTRRLTGAVDWLTSAEETAGLPIGLFGASTGAAAALGTAAMRPDRIHAIVCRGGRVDLASEALGKISAPLLLIVGSFDEPIVRISFQAQRELHVASDVHLIPNATHLFEEPGALEQVTGAAMGWFRDHMPK